MMRFLIAFIAVFAFANIDKKINQTKKTLYQTKVKISNMNQKLDSIAQKLNKSQIYLNNINKQIQELNKNIVELEKSLNVSYHSLKKLQKQQKSLETQKNQLENKLIDFISNNYYVNNLKLTTPEDLINEEILKIVAKEGSNKLDNLSKVYSTLNQKITEINNIISKIKKTKIALENRKKELSTLKKQQLVNIQKLKKLKSQYKKALQTIIANQNKLQNQLAKLNIIKQKELQKQRELANNTLKAKKIDRVKVKNYGNIYMKTKTARYKGRKTIPPLKGIIVKKFGAYKDPVYNINLYNDSITIKASPNSKVRAIFDGIVVFVGNTSEGKMIVIKHKNHLHSIYAKLARISPFIKKGYKVKKGEVIAKVNRELEFEITYKTLPINPLEVVNF